ncbi:hypothetical protein PSBY109024_06465 [Pseudoalteromonas byunsanensis]
MTKHLACVHFAKRFDYILDYKEDLRRNTVTYLDYTHRFFSWST